MELSPDVKRLAAAYAAMLFCDASGHWRIRVKLHEDEDD